MALALESAVQEVEAGLELCRLRLDAFTAFITGWTLPHHQLQMCEALQRLEATPGGRLVITEPPRHGKSEVGSIAFPAWCLGRGMSGYGPIQRVAIAAYGADFAEGFSGSVRDHFAEQDGWLRRVWPDVELASTAAKRWHLRGMPQNRPSCIGVGIGGPFTGRGADLIVIDDPFKTAEDAFSPAYRERVWRWWTSVARTRLQPGGRVVLIMTRWHDDDLAGRLLEKGGWDVQHMPAISDDGKALWPEQYDIAELEAIRDDVGGSTWEALYQGRPAADEGTVWKLADLEEHGYTGKPAECFEVATFWDTAYEEGQENDYTAWCRMGLDWRGHIWLIDCGHRKVEFNDLVRMIDAGAGGDINEMAVIEKAASGRSAYQEIKRSSMRMVKAVLATDSKLVRQKVAAKAAEAGIFHVPLDRPETAILLAELTRFPAAKHDDLADACAAGINYLRKKAAALIADGNGPREMRVR